MSRRIQHRLSLPLAAALAAGACGHAPAHEPSPAPATPVVSPAATSSTPAHAASSPGAIGAVPPGARHTLADARFMEHMTHHHAQALEMVRLIPARTTRADLRLMGERIEVSQQDEIAQMQRWLRVRGHAAPTVGAHAHDAAGTHAGMPGMASTAEMQRLAAARGPAFDRAFLELMIRHHEGAIVMVRELFGSAGAAQETETFSIASEIEADQGMEIARMRGMLARMPSATGTP